MVYSYFIIIGYFKIISVALSNWYTSWKKTIKNVISKSKPSFHSNCIWTVINATEDFAKNITFQLFYSDSDTIIMDNSVNCIVWKNRKDFLDSTYQEIPLDNGTIVNTVHDKGIPIGSGTIQIGWYNDYGRALNCQMFIICLILVAIC